MNQFVTMTLAGRAIGISVADVHDVIRIDRVTAVPQAPTWIAGMTNLRGHIVTVVDMRRRLGLPSMERQPRQVCAVVHHQGEAFALLVDSVGEVISVDDEERAADPVTLPAAWRSVSRGVIQREEALLLELDVASLLKPELSAAA